MIIAVDFDGTVVEHKYPEIGKELPHAVSTLKKLQKKGHKIIIWTCRTGDDAEAARKWLENKGFYPDAVNQNVIKLFPIKSRKVYADVYFDDRSFPAFPGWAAVATKFLNGVY